MLLSKNKKAFTLIEILVVMVVVGFMATIISPRLFRKKDNGTVNTVIKKINGLLIIAKQEAIVSKKNLRLSFNSVKDSFDFVLIEKMNKDPDNKNKEIPESFVSEYLDSKYILPKNIKIESLFLGKNDLLEDNKGKGFCYISKNGLVQDVMLRVIVRQGDFSEKFSCLIDPFIGEFKVVSGFIKPKVNG